MPNLRETGILEEIRLENMYRNPERNFSIWDTILYEKARFQANLTSLLNCSCLDAAMDGDRIQGLTGGTWRDIKEVARNHQRHVRLDIGETLEGIRLVLDETWGVPQSRVYEFSVEPLGQ